MGRSSGGRPGCRPADGGNVITGRSTRRCWVIAGFRGGFVETFQPVHKTTAGHDRRNVSVVGFVKPRITIEAETFPPAMACQGNVRIRQRETFRRPWPAMVLWTGWNVSTVVILS